MFQLLAIASKLKYQLYAKNPHTSRPDVFSNLIIPAQSTNHFQKNITE